MNLASCIDHTILKPTTALADVDQLCTEALQYEFAAVCVPPYYVTEAKKKLQGSRVKTATVIGFPFGYSCTGAKLAEIEDAIVNGADELDMVINIAAVKNGDWSYVKREVSRTVQKIHTNGKTMKLIAESGILTDAALLKCCEIVAENNVDFIKTSTGYAETGATLYAVKLMRENLPSEIFIKASGGIRNFKFAKELIDAGADRLGCSASVAIVNEQNHS